jgi:DNA mismatch repair enzyme (predicted ATPase)
VPELNAIGFDISEFSSLTFKISAVPEALTDINFDKFFAYLTGDLIKTNVKANDVLREKLMQTACKCAIKADDVLSVRQLELLIKAFSDAENKPLQCPHGRPTVIKFSKADFEKWFRRTV